MEDYYKSRQGRNDPKGTGFRIEWSRAVLPTPIEVAAQLMVFAMQRVIKQRAQSACKGCMTKEKAQLPHKNSGCLSSWCEKVNMYGRDIIIECQLTDWRSLLEANKSILGDTLEFHELGRVMSGVCLNDRMGLYLMTTMSRVIEEEHAIDASWDAKFREADRK